MKILLEINLDDPQWAAKAHAAIARLGGAGTPNVAPGLPITSTPNIPPPPAAAVPPPPTTPAPVGTLEYDSAGVAWDAATHSGSKAKNKDGTWRGRREVGSKKAATPAAVPAPIAPPPAAPAVSVPLPPGSGAAPSIDFMGFVSVLSQWSGRTGKQSATLFPHYGNGLSDIVQFSPPEMGPTRDMIARDIANGVHG